MEKVKRPRRPVEPGGGLLDWSTTSRPHRRTARIVGVSVVAVLAALAVAASMGRSDVSTELRCAERAMTRLLQNRAGAEKRMRRCLARARRRALLDYRPAWLSALAWHLDRMTHRCDPKVGGPLKRGACLIRKGRNEAAARLYAEQLPDRSRQYLAGVARRLRTGREPAERPYNGGPRP